MMHPFILVDAAQLERARRRTQTEPWAREYLAELLRDVDAARGEPLPEFERAWWRDAAHALPWAETYPQVNLHTGTIPNAVAARARQSALAYALTGDRRHADEVRRLLTHFARSYTFEIEHYDVAMNTAGWGLQLLEAYDLIWDCVPTEEHAALASFFLQMGERVKADDEAWVAHGWGGAYNNHYAWHKWLLGTLGLLYDRPEWVAYSLDGPMGMRELLTAGVLDGGLWFESSTSYHFTALHGMLPLAETLRHVGHAEDLYTWEAPNGHTLRQLLTAPIAVAWPDLTLPMVGDCYGRRLDLAATPYYEQALAVYEDPALAWVVARGRRDRPAASALPRLLYGVEAPEGQAPAVRSQLFPEHGWALLRQVEGPAYWDSDSLALFATWDCSSVHANADKLGFELFGCGRPLIVDAEARAPGHAFSSEVQRELNRETLAHNTLLVDGRSQRYSPQQLRLVAADLGTDVKAITLADPDGTLYDGVQQQRTFILTPEYVLDVFEVQAAAEHCYDWLLHVASGPTHLNLPLNPATLGDSPAHAWLRNCRSAPVDTSIVAEWQLGDVRLRATVLGAGGTEAWSADFPGDQDHQAAPIPMLGVRRTGTRATFVALYQAARGAPPVAELAPVGGPDPAVTVRLAGREHRHTFPHW